MDPELSVEDKEFLAKCEEELKDRYTEEDCEYMNTMITKKANPPILENYWHASDSGRRTDRPRRRFNPYDQRDKPRDQQHDRRDRHGDRPYDQGDKQGGSSRGYDYNNYNRSRY